MQNVKDAIYKHGIMPVLTIDTLDHALPLVQALQAGGVDIAEVTLRTECALEALAAIRKACPAVVLGAGSVLNREQAEKAIKAGASFIVTPGFSEEVTDFCIAQKVLVIPGCSSATDVQKAANRGLDVVKFFPAAASGGLDAVNALAAVFPNMRFLPTGGIKPADFSPWLRNPRVMAVGTGCVAPADLLAAGDFDGIRKLARDAVFAVLNFTFAHVGINCDTVDEGFKNIFGLADMFNLTLGDTPSSSYVGREVEITKQPFKVRGPHGHIGYFTDNVERAVFYLGKKGIEFNTDSVKPYKGKMYVIYLKEFLAGFAVHIEERNDHNPPAWEHRDVVKARFDWKD